MESLNTILLEGNLTRDPELLHTSKGTAICKFSVASNKFTKQDGKSEKEKEVSFFDVVTWARLAEVCNQYLKKGRGVRVIGSLKQDRWQDTDGKTKSRVNIVAREVSFKPEFNGKKGEYAREEPEAVSYLGPNPGRVALGHAKR